MDPSASTTPTGRSRRGQWHAVAWLGWALAAATVVQLAPSPVYVVLVIAGCALIVETHAEPGPYRRAFPALAVLGAILGDHIGYVVGRRGGRQAVDAIVRRTGRGNVLHRAEAFTARWGAAQVALR